MIRSCFRNIKGGAGGISRIVSLRRLSTVRPCDRDELKKLIQGDDCFVVDVRENEEVLATGPIHSRAINIPLSQFLLDDDGEANVIFERLDGEEFMDEFGVEKPSVSDTIVFSCKAGVRSNMAATQLVEQHPQYKNIFNFTGGADDWFR